MAKSVEDKVQNHKSLWERMTNHKKMVVICLILIGIVFFVVRGWYKASQPPEHKTAEVERSELVKTIEVSGEMEAEESVNLKFQSIGRLGWVGVKVGDQVKKWQAVASLDRRTLEKQLKQDLIAFEKEYRDHAQDVDDYPNISNRFKRILDKAQFDLENAVIDVEIQNLSLELASLVSPIEGIVTRVDTPYAGVNVALTDTITIVNPNTMYFEVEIDESDISGVKVGQLATITLDAFPDDPIESEVMFIDFQSSVAEGGGTVYQTKLKINDNPELRYRLGMSGDADLILEEKADVLVIPTEFLIEREGKYFVEELLNSKVTTKEIEVGTITDDLTEVTRGLSESEEIILTK